METNGNMEQVNLGWLVVLGLMELSMENVGLSWVESSRKGLPVPSDQVVVAVFLWLPCERAV
jgi:hypothetical protein